MPPGLPLWPVGPYTGPAVCACSVWPHPGRGTQPSILGSSGVRAAEGLTRPFHSFHSWPPEGRLKTRHPGQQGRGRDSRRLVSGGREGLLQGTWPPRSRASSRRQSRQRGHPPPETDVTLGPLAHLMQWGQGPVLLNGSECGFMEVGKPHLGRAPPADGYRLGSGQSTPRALVLGAHRRKRPLRSTGWPPRREEGRVPGRAPSMRGPACA